MVFRLIIVLSMILALPAYAAKAITTDVDAQYAIYNGGMKLIDADLKIKADPKDYDSHLTARTTGTLGKIFKWSNNVRSEGTVQARMLSPTQHVSENTWMGKRRGVKLVYDGKGGFESKESIPPPEADNREQVADELTKDTQDVMSAALTLLQRVTQGESCDQTLAVYDGRRRFNLKFSEIGYEDLPKIKYGIFEGRALRCDMTIERVAGYWKKSQIAWTEDGDAKMHVMFWLASTKTDGPVIPVRAMAKGQFGTAVVHLTKATVDGEDLSNLYKN